MFSVAAFWDSSLPFLAPLLDETARGRCTFTHQISLTFLTILLPLLDQFPGSKYQFLTVAVDVTIEGIAETLQFSREVKVRLVKNEPFAIFSKKRLSLDTFYLTLERVS